MLLQVEIVGKGPSHTWKRHDFEFDVIPRKNEWILIEDELFEVVQVSHELMTDRDPDNPSFRPVITVDKGV